MICGEVRTLRELHTLAKVQARLILRVPSRRLLDLYLDLHVN